MIELKDGLYRVTNKITKTELEYLVEKYGGQGSGWWRTGQNEISFKDKDKAQAYLREQRLQELQEEFEAARDDWLDRGSFIHESADDRQLTNREMMDFFSLATGTPDEWAASNEGDSQDVIAARRYIIARDFNEFDPGKADMLWKLQNNG